MSLKPAVLIIHGAWHTPAHYHDLELTLTSRGFRVFIPALPSSQGRPFAEQPAQEDIARIHSVAVELVDQGLEIMALGHSYGGLVMTEALAGLGVQTRSAQGQQGGVRLLFYLSAFMLEEGQSIHSVVPKTSIQFSRYDGDEKVMADGFKLADVMYSDLPEDQKERWSSLTVPTPSASSFYAPKQFAYREISTVFIHCELDMAFPYVGQKVLVQKMREQGVKVDTEVLGSGHFPSLSMPDKLADIIDKYA